MADGDTYKFQVTSTNAAGEVRVAAVEIDLGGKVMMKHVGELFRRAKKSKTGTATSCCGAIRLKVLPAGNKNDGKE